MIDLLFVAILLAFFVLAVGFVRVCDRIIGPDEAAADLVAGAADEEKLAA